MWSFSVYSIQLLSWLLLFGDSIKSSWLLLSRVSALYRYYENYGLVYVININTHNLFYVYRIFISDIYREIVSCSPTPGQQVSVILWNITITFWCLCEIVQFSLNTFIIVYSFVQGQHCVFLIAIIMVYFAISILCEITVWCMSSILIYMPYFSVYTICISEHCRAIVSYSSTPSQQVSVILWNITIPVWLKLQVHCVTFFFKCMKCLHHKLEKHIAPSLFHRTGRAFLNHRLFQGTSWLSVHFHCAIVLSIK